MPEKFKTAFNGYNKEDVNSFIRSVSKSRKYFKKIFINSRRVE